MPSHIFLRLVAIAFYSLAIATSTGALGSESPDEQTLRRAKVDTSTPGLFAYFRSQTLTEAQQSHVGQLVRNLGSRLYEVRAQASRDMIALGSPARAALREAIQSHDPEIARRAEYCAQEIDRRHGQKNALIIAAARLLASRQADGTVEALISYLPCCDDEGVEEEIYAALAGIGFRTREWKESLLNNLAHPQEARRAATAFIAGQSQDPGIRQRVRKLLDDPDPKVRLRAAHGLILGKDPYAVPTLIALLREPSPDLNGKAEELLFRLAGESAPRVCLADGSLSARRAYSEAWLAWWREKGGTIEKQQMALVTSQPRAPIVAEMDSNKVWEMGPDGQSRGDLKGFRGPMDMQLLPNGHVLVAEYLGRMVTEQDQTGRVYWSHKLEDSPVACRRLANGNTFIATHNTLREIAPDGSTVYFRHLKDGLFIFSAERLSNGRIAYIANPGVIQEMEAASGKVLKTVRLGNTFGGWCGLETLTGGRYLVAFLNSGKVMELDPSGKVLWEYTMSGACHATRLPNGHTLIANTMRMRLVEVDSQGTTVREIRTEGRPWRVHSK